MVGDLTEKVQASQNAFERLTSRIPGYGGYKRKEQRRDADKLLRLHVARQYEEQLKRLNEVQYTVTSTGGLALIVPLERGSMRLQLLIDRIKTASYGYAGLFDATKVGEEELDGLYAFDESMLDGVQSLSTILDNLTEAADSSSLTKSHATELLRAVDALNETFSRRQDVILE